MPPESRLSHYAILDKLGEGGMGVLFRARDTRLERTVAIKLLRGDGALDPLQRRRFVQEARAASALNHPNIVTIYEIGREGGEGADYIVMEYVEGRPLSLAIAGRRLPPAEAVGFALPMASALAAAHAAGVVHRDVKPANVMVTGSGQVKVLDFGLAKLQAASPPDPASGDTVTTGPHTTAGMIVGTPAYMSPEQAQGQSVEASSDVFSLGACLYEMLAGRRPFVADNTVALLSAILRDDPPSLRSLRGDVPPELDRLVQSCLSKEAARRPSSSQVAQELAAIHRQLTLPPTALGSLLRRKAVAIPLALLLVAGGVAGALSWRRAARVRWARETVLPEVGRLLTEVGAAPAFRRLREVEPLVGHDAQYRELERSTSVPANLESEPAGAAVSYKDYLEPDSPWQALGTTPLKGVRVPMTQLRWRFEAPGRTPAELAFFPMKPPAVRLVEPAATPEGMVWVPGGESVSPAVKSAAVGGFWIDRQEVTNAQFKKFVDEGGYRRPELWKHAFVDGVSVLSSEAARARFVDTTGRPGPAGWELGTYPAKQADFPLGGVSWYEAAAFAEFSGKALPTVHHWYRAAGLDIFSEILRFSNFSGEGPRSVALGQGLGPFGTVDMAGNVREWCWNAAGAQRYVLGGAWSDPTYMFTSAEALFPFDRNPANGIRLVRYEAPPSPTAGGPIEFDGRDYTREQPVSDAVFASFRGGFDEARPDLAARVEAVDDSGEYWRRETITVSSGSGTERLPLYVFLPRNARPPYQVVEYFPPGSAFLAPSSKGIGSREFGFLVRSGRAVVFPVYTGTYERRVPGPKGPGLLRDLMVQQVRDARRALDYVASRPDLDATRIGYYGLSSGAHMGLLIAAMEPRLRAVVLASGGLGTRKHPFPDVDGLNFAPRITAPTLLACGRNDFLLPVEMSQRPLFRLLGTPAADKRHFLYEGGHVPPVQQDVIRETLAWLDKYLGPVAGPN